MAASVLSVLDLTPKDQIIIIRENYLADSTFVLASILSKCFKDDTNVCLVSLHNTLLHFNNVGKRIGFDFNAEVDKGTATFIDFLSEISNDLYNNQNPKYLTTEANQIVKQLLLEINNKIKKLLSNNKHISVVIDDISHLLDLSVTFNEITRFIQHLVGLTINKNISIIVNCHVASETDNLISNLLQHSADVAVIVSNLKTGRSWDVSGVLIVNRNSEIQNEINKQAVYHYRLFEKEIRVFAPGKSYI